MEHRNWTKLEPNDSKGVVAPFGAKSPSNTLVESYSLGTKVWPIIGILRYCFSLNTISELDFLHSLVGETNYLRGISPLSHTCRHMHININFLY